MKINLFKSQTGLKPFWLVAAFLGVVCVALSQTPSKDQKRVTGLQIGEGSEGARVTIVADSALNDYEAFRRGDYFYVRIPLAEFSTAQPTFRGDGFDDVQVQRIGDSVVVSFKLQPGASARVAEGTNRLEVFFTSPARLARNNPAGVRGRTVGSSTGPRANASRRAIDVAGPVPPGSPNFDDAGNGSTVTDENFYTEGHAVSTGRGPKGRRDSLKPEGQIGSVQAVPTPVSTVNTSSTGYPPVTNATPWMPEPSTSTSSPSSINTGKNRTDKAFQWVKANRVAILIGSLVLLGATVFLTLMIRRRKTVVNAKLTNTSKVQPKYLADDDFEAMFGEHASDDFVASQLWQDQPQSTSPIAEDDYVQQELRERVGRVTEPTLEPVEPKFYVSEPWNSDKTTADHFRGYEKWEEHEREVIEL
jgi:hypothetical protein